MEDLSVREELQVFFENIVKHSSLENKPDEEISKIIKDSLKLQLNKIEDKLKRTNLMTIKEADIKRKKYKEQISKVCKMLELFEEEFGIFIANYHADQETSRKVQDRREKLSNLIVDMMNTKVKPTQEILEEIKTQAREKYPIQEEK